MMKLRTKYVLFVVFLHGLALVLSFFIFREKKLLFIASELVILVSVWIAWRLYVQLIQPLNLLIRGADAIRERDFNVKFVATGKYEMDQLIDVYNRMIDALRMERTRQEQQHLFLEKLIYTSPTGIVILDYDERVRQINPKALALLGAAENDFMGKDVGQLSHPVLQQVKQLRSGESRMVSVDGINTYKLQKSHFIDRGFPRHFIMIEELTAEILAAEKKAYGKVIRMMAHEVNNTIGPVNSILQTALRFPALQGEGNVLPGDANALPGGDPAKSLKDALQVAIDRNYNLNHFMRNFADVVRLPEPVPAPFDLCRLVQDTVLLMEMKAGEKEIRFQSEPGPLSGQVPFIIHADQQQMEQVLINVIKNAMEAIENRGSIGISLDAVNRQLTIADSGTGISAGVAEQLFSPFFSTKKDGQGIGLTLVKEVLLNHGYEFSLKTVAPGRTEFLIQF